MSIYKNAPKIVIYRTTSFAWKSYQSVYKSTWLSIIMIIKGSLASIKCGLRLGGVRVEPRWGDPRIQAKLPHVY